MGNILRNHAGGEIDRDRDRSTSLQLLSPFPFPIMNERKMPEESKKRMLMPFRSVRRSISSGRKKNFWNFWNDLKEDLRSIVCASNPACAGKSLIKPVLCKIAFF